MAQVCVRHASQFRFVHGARPDKCLGQLFPVQRQGSLVVLLQVGWPAVYATAKTEKNDSTTRRGIWITSHSP